MALLSSISIRAIARDPILQSPMPPIMPDDSDREFTTIPSDDSAVDDCQRVIQRVFKTVLTMIVEMDGGE
jgi:hypothetical protein